MGHYDNVEFAYSPAIASDSMPSYTSTEVISLSELEAFMNFHLLIQSSLAT